MSKFKIISIIVGFSMLAFLFVSWNNSKKESKRQKENYENLLKELKKTQLDVVEMNDRVIELNFKNKEELEEYLSSTENQLKGLEEKLKDADVKLSRVSNIISTKLQTSDTTSNEILLDNISNILKALEKQERLEIPFEDKTGCFEFKAKLIFEDGTASVNVIERKYNDTLTSVGSWERRKWSFLGLWKWRLFGKRVAKITIFNNCGFSETIIITKDGKKAKEQQ